MIDIVTMDEIKNNTFHRGVAILRGKNMEIMTNELVYQDKLSNTGTYYVQLKLNRGMTFQEALQLKGDKYLDPHSKSDF